MIATLRQRNFALLWVGGLISMTGDAVLYITLPFHVYHLTGSVLSTGFMFIAGTIPGLLFGSIAGVFVDRWNRKQALIIASFLQGLCILTLFLVRSIEWLWVVYLVSFIESAIVQFFSPAEKALLPNLVSEKHLITANSLNALNQNFAILLGPAIGGTLFAFWGLTGIILFDSISFFIAAVLIIFIKWSPQKTKEETSLSEIETINTVAFAFKSVLRDWLEGFRLIKSNRMVIILFVSVGFANIGSPIIDVLFIPYVNIINGGALVLGWLLTVRGLGGLLGGFIAGKIGNSFRHTLIYSLGLCATGIILLLLFNIPILPVSIICIFLLGIPFVIFNVSYLTLFQSSVPDQFRGRIFGTWGTIVSVLIIFGQVSGSTLGDHVGIIPILNVGSILFIISGLVAFFMMGRIKSKIVIPNIGIG